ncbi:MAG: copper resistance protein NlpE N-terminal domain-containing protein, partial [Acinetobacter sp.]|nr:copper resistance protein NlpE N-terminal domain-containing protein [Acinetobacter sp.]
MKKTFLMLVLSSVALAACSKPETPNSAAPAASAAAQPASEASAPASTLPAGDTAETSLDWAGKYKGVLPCADCEGIEMELELKSDKTYELTEEYLGKGKGNEFKTKGA